MKTVQVAIQDREYAEAVRDLLRDCGHVVHLLDIPDWGLDGVIVVDAVELNSYGWLVQSPERLVVMAHKDRDDLSKVWEHGVRHVIFEGDPPQTARTIILGIELGMSARGASSTA
jgi:hypothetical protein